MARALSPGYGSCGKCGMTWNWTKEHSTEYSVYRGFISKGCFPLCEHCWNELTIEQRLPYYEELFVSWKQFGYQHPRKLRQIKKAVLAGK